MAFVVWMARRNVVRVAEEPRELAPGLLPQPVNHWVTGVPPAAELLEHCMSGLCSRGGVDSLLKSRQTSFVIPWSLSGHASGRLHFFSFLVLLAVIYSSWSIIFSAIYTDFFTGAQKSLLVLKTLLCDFNFPYSFFFQNAFYHYFFLHFCINPF